ncbi:DUF1638 domain-containing protein [Methanosarcina mazei]|jgi:hypothetical protein|uniref:DUF1638 domain-containing protein n=2 Tax=Methanosarcina mazei TaxID=2209 RepID=A0A0F8J0J4_METMZ|nr:DUF1638 domain-containing protein [Methanosarcina mazei]AKB70616.1 hypothetical protein MSMAC_0726 [Methanosarcina mazei C16]KKF97846.1 hypothetical protein DU47_19810 [Methanosarcina mazei]KKF99769.1 hypothetical protein DU40_12210 [Methanosarcina mazei]KKG08124.1 hypothetical protein DU34_19120 [Methanosarcina mazei]KKG30216.1 hypothetical protein DU49_08870 [Methanosarcina mazei]
MPVITILGCRMFEDEIMHLLENDPEIEEVLVVENEDCVGIMKKMAEAGLVYTALSPEKIPEKSSEAGKGLTLIVYMLELALHAIPENLKKTVYSKVELMSSCSDGILLFYGLCGNVLGKIEEDFKDLGCQVCILKEENGEIVDDCIGAVLGGRKQYLEVLKSCKGVGTFFLTPMWAVNWREMIRTSGLSQNPDDISMSKFVFDYAGYKRVARLDTGLAYEKDFDACVKEFSTLFEFEVTELEGTLHLIENCYAKTKASVFEACPRSQA